MHWLQSIDLALFHFINGTLANSAFDWLMPVLSGNGVPWLLAMVIGVPAVLLWGSTRLKLCVLVMVLVVALGDPLVIGTIKHTVKRPRPFVTQHEARLFGQVGKGYLAPLPDGTLPANANRQSMPSAHAANTFAVAVIGFLFYRRRAWFLFVAAAAISISRVYNGVHYPTDITVGALLGMGYAFILAGVLQGLWTMIGSVIFPRWHEQLPCLLKPEEPAPGAIPSLAKPTAASVEWLRLGYIVIALALIGRWFYIGSDAIDLSGDEAYQWLWSKHLALSYYSKPPGIAWLQWLGTAIGGDTTFGVRFCSPLLGAILSVLVLRFMAREASPRAAFCLLAITFAVPLLTVGSVLMTIDPPLVLCWMWAVIAGWKAVQPEGKTRDWLIVGLAMGLGFLCKYTAMLQLICWAFFFGLYPAARHHLRRRGPWLALLIFVICTLPVVIWNQQHHWITVKHVAGDGGFLDTTKLTWSEQLANSLGYFGEFTGAELGLLNPIFLIGCGWAWLAAWQRRQEKPLWFFLFCMSAPVFIGHWLFSLHSRVQPNWIAAAVPPMFCLMVLYWNESPRKICGWLAGGLALGIAASAFMYSSDLIGKLAGSKLPGDKDFSHRTRGWKEAAQTVELERMKFAPNGFIIADHYSSTGLFSIYSKPAREAAVTATPLVYCIDCDTNKPINQFAFWDQYQYQEHRKGQNAIYVIRLEPYKLESGWIGKWLRHEPINYREIPAPRPVPASIADQFQSVTNLGVREIKLDDGRIFQRVQIYGCIGLK